MKKAFFLDRDGVLNVETGYLHEAEKTVLLPTVAEAVELIHRAGYLAVVVTNQSGVAKKMYPPENILEVNSRIQSTLIASGSSCTLDAWYYCPHDPAITGECVCRKPAPGMFFKAAADLDIDLRSSFMIGDRIHDLHAGKNAGCAGGCLVTTGDPEIRQKHRERAVEDGFPVAGSLIEAVKILLK